MGARKLHKVLWGVSLPTPFHLCLSMPPNISEFGQMATDQRTEQTKLTLIMRRTSRSMNKDEELAAEKMINVTHSTDKNILGMFFLLYHSDWWLLPVQTGCSTRETDKHIIPPLKKSTWRMWHVICCTTRKWFSTSATFQKLFASVGVCEIALCSVRRC